ncbi:c-type cytochrome biogenesis protein CcmI [Brevundimonas sp.]|uniref:c-type cytochrome biogenesis protein CcmI n=1 Tax=Brevundimonas sp. TaxID=1871086 RepID=UPI003BAD9985
MAIFSILCALATALAALMVLTGARRGADAGQHNQGQASGDPEPADAAARELDELDRLKARGLLAEDAWVSARAEAARRLLSTTVAPMVLRNGRRDRQWVLGGLAVTALGVLGLYGLFGAPGMGDQAYASRVEAWAESTEPLEPAQVAAVLTREAANRPDEPAILTMLGAARFQAGDPIGAASAFRRVLAIRPDDAQSWARLGESLVRSQDGVVGADAEAAFREAVKRDPDQLGALFFLGDAALTRGDVAEARRQWTPLMAALDPADPRRAELEQRLAGAGQ